MNDRAATETRELQEDPVFLHSRREAMFILGLWAACLVYTVTFCYLHGYVSHEPHPASTGPSVGAILGALEGFNREPSSIEMPLGLGIPDWVFYGVVIPWMICIALTFWFCLSYFVEDDLTADGESGTRESPDG